MIYSTAVYKYRSELCFSCAQMVPIAFITWVEWFNCKSEHKAFIVFYTYQGTALATGAVTFDAGCLIKLQKWTLYTRCYLISLHLLFGKIRLYNYIYWRRFETRRKEGKCRGKWEGMEQENENEDEKHQQNFWSSCLLNFPLLIHVPSRLCTCVTTIALSSCTI